MSLVFNVFTGEFDYTGSGGGGTPSNSFSTMQTPAGTSPVATSPTDTLTWANGTNISISGNSGTDTITVNAIPSDGNTAIQYNDSGVFGGDSNFTWNKTTKLNTITNAGLSTTTATAIRLLNSTAATVGTQVQVSPAIVFEGQAWKSFAPAASQTTIWRTYNRLNPYSSTTTGGDLRFDASVNGAAFNTVLTLASGSANGNTDANLTLSGRYVVNHNNSDASPSTATTSPAWRINNTGTWSHLSFAFSGTFKGALSVSSAGDVRTYTSDKYTWIRDFTSLTQLAELNSAGLQVQAGYGLFAGRVTAGFIDTTAPAVLNSRGSVAAQGTYVTGQSYYQLTINDWALYIDVSSATTCLGTPAACSTYGTQGACEVVDDCVWSAGASCSIFTDQETCEWEAGCTWGTTACSTLGDETSCNSAGGDCNWTTGNSCGDFATEEECTPSGCTWSGATCDGTYDICAGTTYPSGPCTGTYGTGCSGTVAPCYLQTTCGSVTGCTSSTGTAVILPPLSSARESNTSRFHWIKNVGSTNNVTVLPYPGDTLEGTTVTLDPAASLGTHPILGQASCTGFGSQGACEGAGCSWTNGCSAYGDESSCNAQSGCSWTGDECVGNYSCTGSYTVLDRWNILSLYT